MAFRNVDMQRGLRRLIAGGLSLGLIWADRQIEAQGVAVQVEEQLAVEPVAGQEAEFDDLDAGPGFMLPMADETVREQMAKFDGHLDRSEWGEAFRVLTELAGDRLDAMVPVDDRGLHLSVRELVQRRLLAMPPEGRRAFRLYFDGQAREMLTAVREHPRPGSDERLALAQRLVDRMLASSVGGEAAELLGDLYFERGGFTRADRNWRYALEQGSASTGDALRLQVKRVWALYRDGDTAKAAELFDQLSDRYGDATLTIGGQQVDAIAQLKPIVGQAEPGDNVDKVQLAKGPLRLPEKDALPTWHLPFMSTTNRSSVDSSRSTSPYYRGPANLPRHVPVVVADDTRVYFHYLGAVFALDRTSGKILWHEGSLSAAAKSVDQRHRSTAGNPAGYQIALSDQAVLITSTTPGDNSFKQLTVSARDKESGGLIWSSVSRGDWGLSVDGNPPVGAALAGQVLVNGDRAYAVVFPPKGTDYFLRRFDPATGEVDWTIRLGAIDPIVFRQEVRQVPQPRLALGRSELFVMTNNGVLLAVDQAGGQINWGLEMDTPFGVGAVGGSPFSYNQGLQTKLEAMANPNGAGAMLMKDGVLYAKQHYGSTLFAIDPGTGKVHWSADKLDADAQLVGLDDQRFYLADNAINGYELAGDHNQAWKNNIDTIKQDQTGVILHGAHAIAMSNRKLRLVDTKTGDFIQTFKDENYLGQYGGRLYRFDDLLVCVDRTQITAYSLAEKDPN